MTATANATAVVVVFFVVVVIVSGESVGPTGEIVPPSAATVAAAAGRPSHGTRLAGAHRPRPDGHGSGRVPPQFRRQAVRPAGRGGPITAALRRRRRGYRGRGS